MPPPQDPPCLVRRVHESNYDCSSKHNLALRCSSSPIKSMETSPRSCEATQLNLEPDWKPLAKNFFCKTITLGRRCVVRRSMDASRRPSAFDPPHLVRSDRCLVPHPVLAAVRADHPVPHPQDADDGFRRHPVRHRPRDSNRTDGHDGQRSHFSPHRPNAAAGLGGAAPDAPGRGEHQPAA